MLLFPIPVRVLQEALLGICFVPEILRMSYGKRLTVARMVGLVSWLFTVFVLPAAADDTGTHPDKGTPPDLKLIVALQKDSLHPEDSIPVKIWLANSSDIDLSRLELHVDAPGFLRLASGSCRPPPDHGSREPGSEQDSRASKRWDFPLQGLGAYGARSESFVLCADRDIVEGSFRLLFAVEFGWETNGKLAAGTGLSVVEKTIEVSLLSSESFGGFSLRLAAAVLPGLILLLALRLVGVAWVARLTSVETAALSLLFSALMNGAAAVWFPQPFSGGMSLWRLAVVTGASLVLGGFFYLGRMFLRWWHAGRPRLAGKPFRPEKDRVFRNLLRRLKKEGGAKNFEVVTADGETYRGSAGGRTHDDSTVLLYGWFEIKSRDPEVQETLKQHFKSGSFAGMLDLAGMRGLDVVCSNSIQRLDKTGQERLFDRPFARWAASQVVRDGLTEEGLRKRPVSVG